MKGLQWLAEPPADADALTPAGRRRLEERMFSTLSVNRWGDMGDVELFLRGWFLDRVESAGDLKRGNVMQWFSWAIFYKFPTDLTPTEHIELQQIVDRFEARSGLRFAPGFSPDQKAMRLTLDTVTALHRPLLFYAVVAVFNSVSKLLLSSVLGFTRRRIGGMHYWYKPHVPPAGRSRRSMPPPLVFIHGLGQGLLNYLHFVAHIQDRDVFLVELSHISMRVWEHIPSGAEVAGFIHTVLQEHNYSRAVFMGHSFGTIAIAWCIRRRPDMVHAASKWSQGRAGSAGRVLARAVLCVFALGLLIRLLAYLCSICLPQCSSTR